MQRVERRAISLRYRWGMDVQYPLQHVVCLDFETGGHDASVVPVLSVAICRPEGVWPTLEAQWLVRESESALACCDPRALEVNGHCLDEVRAEGKSPRQVALELAAQLDKVRDSDGRVYVVAHNAPFDVAFLDRLFRLAGLGRPPQMLWVCSMALALALRWARGRGPYSLSSLARRYGVPTPDAHTALGDARTLADVLPYLLSELGPGPRRASAPRPQKELP